MKRTLDYILSALQCVSELYTPHGCVLKAVVSAIIIGSIVVRVLYEIYHYVFGS